MFRDYSATAPYTREECAQYLKNNDTYIHVQGDYIPREKFLTIVTHAGTTIMTTLTHTNDKANKNARRKAGEQVDPGEPSPEIRITQDGEYYARIKGTWYEMELSYLGTPIIGERTRGTPSNLARHAPPGTIGRRIQIQQKNRIPASR